MATAQSNTNDWLKSQQQYWDTWFESQRKAFGDVWGNPAPGAAASGPWADFFKEWQNAVFGPNQQAPHTDAFRETFTKTGETFLNMMQQFYQATGQAKPLDQMTQEWTNGLQKFFTDMFQSNTKPFDISAQGQPFMDAFAKAQQSWGDFLKNGPAGKDPFAAFDPFGFYASIPGIGYSREKQEQLNHLYQQWVEYERKSREYNAAMAKVGLEAVQKFQEYLAHPPKDQAPLTSLKSIYTKWVDICEDIYAKYAMTAEYTKLYGDVVNAMMSFKKQQSALVDDMMEQMNLPTRREVDSLHERLHVLRRDNMQLKKDIAELKAALRPKTAAASAKKPAKKGKK